MHGEPIGFKLVGEHTPWLHAALMTQSPVAAPLGVHRVPSGLLVPLQLPSAWHVSMVVHSFPSSQDCCACSVPANTAPLLASKNARNSARPRPALRVRFPLIECIHSSPVDRALGERAQLHDAFAAQLLDAASRVAEIS